MSLATHRSSSGQSHPGETHSPHPFPPCARLEEELLLWSTKDKALASYRATLLLWPQLPVGQGNTYSPGGSQPAGGLLQAWPRQNWPEISDHTLLVGNSFPAPDRALEGG